MSKPVGPTDDNMESVMMPEQADDPDDAVERLETALERIARLAGQPAPANHNIGGLHAGVQDGDDHPNDIANSPLVPPEEIATRLDGLIDRLRVALSNKAG